MLRCSIDWRLQWWPILLLGGLISGCSSSLAPEILDQMKADLRQNHLVLADFEQLEDVVAYHQAWYAAYTDSIPSPDSLLRVRVHQVDTKFRDWFARHVAATRQLRIHLGEMDGHLYRARAGTRSRIQVTRAWDSDQLEFDRLSAHCRKVQDSYLALADAYAVFDTLVPGN